MTTPRLRDIVENQADDYPTGFQLPYQALVRTAFVSRREDLIAGSQIQFEFPGVGTLTFAGRAYRFDFTAAYAKAKNYADFIEGIWG